MDLPQHWPLSGGQQYLESIQSFFENTGFSKFVHDGSYPGDWDAASRPPLQKGLNDSQWVHVETDHPALPVDAFGRHLSKGS